MQLEPQTLDVVDRIRGYGYSFSLAYDKTGFVATAKDTTGQTWTARAIDAHAAVVEVAAQIGIDLEDV